MSERPRELPLDIENGELIARLHIANAFTVALVDTGFAGDAVVNTKNEQEIPVEDVCAYQGDVSFNLATVDGVHEQRAPSYRLSLIHI